LSTPLLDVKDCCHRMPAVAGRKRRQRHSTGNVPGAAKRQFQARVEPNSLPLSTTPLNDIERRGAKEEGGALPSYLPKNKLSDKKSQRTHNPQEKSREQEPWSGVLLDTTPESTPKPARAPAEVAAGSMPPMTSAHDSKGGAHRHKSDRNNYGQKRPPFKTASNISICYLPPSSPFQNHSSQTLAIGRIHKCRSPCIYWRRSHLWLWPPGGSCERRRRLAAAASAAPGRQITI
jgi:hypothetical protein